MPGCFVCTLPFFAPCDAMLTMLVCATSRLSMHLYTLSYMSMHEFCLLVCHPWFNKMKLWTFDPNLHFSLVNTTFCLLSCLSTFSLVCLFACFLVSLYAMSIMLSCFMPLSYAFCFFFLPFLVCWFLVFAFACPHME